MRVDSFLFNTELDMLELRLSILDPVMHKFVICESTVEFSGKPKPLHYLDNKDRFAPWKDKIKHYVISDTPDSGANRWPREYHQRGAIIRALDGCSSGDLVYMSDVDEIPDPNQVKLNKHGGFRQVYSMYYLNTVRLEESWVGTTAMYYSQYAQLGMQQARNDRYKLQIVNPGGWHFAYVLPPELMHRKLNAFAHSEWDNPEIHAAMEQRRESLADLFGVHKTPLQTQDISAGYFPEHLKANQVKYAHLIKI
jgi:beta-1,4-mannosyl-glycoprotein beta-1,4-N-acetylglucosaminyltransferase